MITAYFWPRWALHLLPGYESGPSMSDEGRRGDKLPASA
jgi:hypothetical protein